MHFYQWFTKLPVLTKANEGLINRTVPVGVKVPHDITDGLGGLPKALVIGIAILIHRVQDPPLNRLEAITDIWQGPLLNDGF